MGQRIDDENELAALREKAQKWDSFVKFIDSLPEYQKWLKSQSNGEKLKDSEKP